MTWEELCEKAKEMDFYHWKYYKRWNDILLRDMDNFLHVAFMKDGSVHIVDEGNFICLIRRRTPDQMYQIMKALQ